MSGEIATAQSLPLSFGLHGPDCKYVTKFSRALNEIPPAGIWADGALTAIVVVVGGAAVVVVAGTVVVGAVARVDADLPP